MPANNDNNNNNSISSVFTFHIDFSRTVFHLSFFQFVYIMASTALYPFIRPLIITLTLLVMGVSRKGIKHTEFSWQALIRSNSNCAWLLNA